MISQEQGTVDISQIQKKTLQVEKHRQIGALGGGDLAEKVVAQLEFYLSTANLDTDAWLRKELEKTKKGWISLRKFIRFPKMRALLVQDSLPAVKINFIRDAVQKISKSLVCANNGPKGQPMVRRRRRYRLKENKRYATLWIAGVEGCSREALLSFLGGYAKVLKITLKERWLFADVEDPTELLKLNGQVILLTGRPLVILTKKEYRQTQKDLKETERKLKLPDIDPTNLM